MVPEGHPARSGGALGGGRSGQGRGAGGEGRGLIAAARPENRHELLRRGYAALSERDFEAVADLLPADFEFEPGETSPLEGGVYTGGGLVRALADNAEAFERTLYTPERIVDVGADRAIVLLRIAARPHGSSLDVNIQIAHLWRFEGESARHLKVYIRPEDAFEAVGLPPQRLPGV